MKLKGLKINFLGDSITEGAWVTNREDNIFWQRLKNDGCIVKGYGIGGTRIARQQGLDKGQADYYFRTRVEIMDPDADLVVIFGGTNDYGHGNAAMGRMSDRTDDTFYGALHCLYTDILKKYPNSQIIVMTPIHRLSEERVCDESDSRKVILLSDYVNVIREVAKYYSIPILDLYESDEIQPADEDWRKKYMPDGLHPNDEGHIFIYNELKGFIKSL